MLINMTDQAPILVLEKVWGEEEELEVEFKYLSAFHNLQKFMRSV
jgi:hypothetical protein